MPPNASIADLRATLRRVSEPPFLRGLDRLRFVAQRSVSHRPGATPVARVTQASGLELAAHKPYAPGDDLRYVDWNALARLDQRVVRTFRAEREAPLHLLLDASASMGSPPADGKLAFAAGLAASLAYIALRLGSPVRAAVLANASRNISPMLRHMQRLPELHAFLAPLTPAGPTYLAEGIEAYLRTTQLPGTVIVLSDFLLEARTAEAALDQLRGRGYDVVALRPIGPGERDASALPRRLQLRDVETGTIRDVEIDAAGRQAYAAAVTAHLQHLKAWCEGRDVAFAAPDTAAGLAACLLADLPRIGVLQ